jgi:CPA2 family monovalent cation:H+ antiporter-2
MIGAAVNPDTARVDAEVGGLLVVLGLVARIATKFHIASPPLYLLIGGAFGVGGLIELDFSQPFIEVSAEVGAILLLLFLGLEFSAKTIVAEARLHRKTALVDIALNGIPSAVFGLLMGWSPIVSLAMAGVTYISSSGIVVQVAREMRWKSRPEWKSLVTILVLEDLAMAPYLPVLAAAGGAAAFWSGAFGVGLGLSVVAILLFVGARGLKPFEKILRADAGSSLLLTTLGLALLAGGVAALFDFSSAIAAFFVGLLITGELAEAIRNRMAPLRDIFAAVFFVFFGFQTDPVKVLNEMPITIVLVAVTWLAKVATVYYSLDRSRLSSDQRKTCALRGGSLLSARGEFSLAIGVLVIGFDDTPSEFQAVVAAYVFMSAFVGPLIARFVDKKTVVELPKPFFY